MKQRQKGFTLIEMLVAMAIFSALIAMLMLGFQQGLLMWEKGQKQSNVWLDYEFRYRLLDTLVSQAVVSDDECAVGVFAPYFFGSQHSAKFISSAPIMDVPGRVRFVMLEAVNKADGSWVLRYREGRQSSIWGQQSRSDEPWVIILEGLRKVLFSFEAPARPLPVSIDVNWWSEDEKALFRDKSEWFNDYAACKLRFYPQQMKIHFIDAAGEKHDWLFAASQGSDAWTMQAYINE